MKYLTSLAASLLSFSLFATPFQPVTFLEASLTEARQQAAEEGKLLLVHFAAGWCMPCQWMEEHTFTDPALASYLQEAYIALRADVDEVSGQTLQQQFEVKKLPTILAFSSRGQLLGRHEGAMEAEALLGLLQAYDQPYNRASPDGQIKRDSLLSSPRAILRLSRSALLPDASTARPATLPFPAAAQPTPLPTQQASRQQQPFFAIQAGLFNSYENAVRESTKLEKAANATVQLAPDSSTGQTVFRLYLGRFSRREDARVYLQELEQRGIVGFVKEIGE